ncbi:hypothetical protein ACFSTI_29465 [Rhizorhabdus histidinilytica]
MLTVTEVRNAEPREKPYKLADSKGLHLFVTTKGRSRGGSNIAMRSWKSC